jgi:DNA-binding CsgD family transcriptional regulator
MGIGDQSVVMAERLMTSNSLRRFVRSVSDTAVATFNGDDSQVTLCTFDNSNNLLDLRLPSQAEDCLRRSRSRVASVEPHSLTAEELVGLQASVQDTTGVSPLWRAFNVNLGGGWSDRIALQISDQDELTLAGNYIEKVWPILRETCLREVVNSQEIMQGDDAFHSSLLDRVDVAILILDGRGLMYRVNAAARQMLKQGHVLRRAKGGVFASTEADSHAFRTALADCVSSDYRPDTDTLLFLSRKDCAQRTPVTLTRYVHEGRATRFVVAMLPMPPDQQRIEELVLKMGLSPSEAKVAALMQLGLTNKEAAAQAGFKEQTFNTYAKRVFSKLDVSGRTEMAQLLTWQAAGRHWK